ncbi:MAG: hypothetical protein RR140_02025, partial [Clostridia bacterium]
ITIGTETTKIKGLLSWKFKTDEITDEIDASSLITYKLNTDLTSDVIKNSIKDMLKITETTGNITQIEILQHFASRFTINLTASIAGLGLSQDIELNIEPNIMISGGVTTAGDPNAQSFVDANNNLFTGIFDGATLDFSLSITFVKSKDNNLSVAFKSETTGFNSSSNVVAFNKKFGFSPDIKNITTKFGQMQEFNLCVASLKDNNYTIIDSPYSWNKVFRFYINSNAKGKIESTSVFYLNQPNNTNFASDFASDNNLNITKINSNISENIIDQSKITVLGQLIYTGDTISKFVNLTTADVVGNTLTATDGKVTPTAPIKAPTMYKVVLCYNGYMLKNADSSKTVEINDGISRMVYSYFDVVLCPNIIPNEDHHSHFVVYNGKQYLFLSSGDIISGGEINIPSYFTSFASGELSATYSIPAEFYDGTKINQLSGIVTGKDCFVTLTCKMGKGASEKVASRDFPILLCPIKYNFFSVKSDVINEKTNAIGLEQETESGLKDFEFTNIDGKLNLSNMLNKNFWTNNKIAKNIQYNAQGTNSIDLKNIFSKQVLSSFATFTIEAEDSLSAVDFAAVQSKIIEEKQVGKINFSDVPINKACFVVATIFGLKIIVRLNVLADVSIVPAYPYIKELTPDQSQNDGDVLNITKWPFETILMSEGILTKEINFNEAQSNLVPNKSVNGKRYKIVSIKSKAEISNGNKVNFEIDSVFLQENGVFKLIEKQNNSTYASFGTGVNSGILSVKFHEIMIRVKISLAEGSRATCYYNVFSTKNLDNFILTNERIENPVIYLNVNGPESLINNGRLENGTTLTKEFTLLQQEGVSQNVATSSLKFCLSMQNQNAQHLVKYLSVATEQTVDGTISVLQVVQNGICKLEITNKSKLPFDLQSTLVAYAPNGTSWQFPIVIGKSLTNPVVTKKTINANGIYENCITPPADATITKISLNQSLTNNCTQSGYVYEFNNNFLTLTKTYNQASKSIIKILKDGSVYCTSVLKDETDLTFVLKISILINNVNYEYNYELIVMADIGVVSGHESQDSVTIDLPPLEGGCTRTININQIFNEFHTTHTFVAEVVTGLNIASCSSLVIKAKNTQIGGTVIVKISVNSTVVFGDKITNTFKLYGYYQVQITPNIVVGINYPTATSNPGVSGEHQVAESVVSGCVINLSKANEMLSNVITGTEKLARVVVEKGGVATVKIKSSSDVDVKVNNASATSFDLISDVTLELKNTKTAGSIIFAIHIGEDEVATYVVNVYTSSASIFKVTLNNASGQQNGSSMPEKIDVALSSIFANPELSSKYFLGIESTGEEIKDKYQTANGDAVVDATGKPVLGGLSITYNEYRIDKSKLFKNIFVTTDDSIKTNEVTSLNQIWEKIYKIKFKNLPEINNLISNYYVEYYFNAKINVSTVEMVASKESRDLNEVYGITLAGKTHQQIVDATPAVNNMYTGSYSISVETALAQYDIVNNIYYKNSTNDYKYMQFYGKKEDGITLNPFAPESLNKCLLIASPQQSNSRFYKLIAQGAPGGTNLNSGVYVTYGITIKCGEFSYKQILSATIKHDYSVEIKNYESNGTFNINSIQNPYLIDSYTASDSTAHNFILGTSSPVQTVGKYSNVLITRTQGAQGNINYLSAKVLDKPIFEIVYNGPKGFEPIENLNSQGTRILTFKKPSYGTKNIVLVIEDEFGFNFKYYIRLNVEKGGTFPKIENQVQLLNVYEGDKIIFKPSTEAINPEIDDVVLNIVETNGGKIPDNGVEIECSNAKFKWSHEIDEITKSILTIKLNYLPREAPISADLIVKITLEKGGEQTTLVQNIKVNQRYYFQTKGDELKNIYVRDDVPFNIIDYVSVFDAKQEFTIGERSLSSGKSICFNPSNLKGFENYFKETDGFKFTKIGDDGFFDDAQRVPYKDFMKSKSATPNYFIPQYYLKDGFINIKKNIDNVATETLTIQLHYKDTTIKFAEGTANIIYEDEFLAKNLGVIKGLRIETFDANGTNVGIVNCKTATESGITISGTTITIPTNLSGAQKGTNMKIYVYLNAPVTIVDDQILTINTRDDGKTANDIVQTCFTSETNGTIENYNIPVKLDAYERKHISALANGIDKQVTIKNGLYKNGEKSRFYYNGLRSDSSSVGESDAELTKFGNKTDLETLKGISAALFETQDTSCLFFQKKLDSDFETNVNTQTTKTPSGKNIMYQPMDQNFIVSFLTDKTNPIDKTNIKVAQQINLNMRVTTKANWVDVSRAYNGGVCEIELPIDKIITLANWGKYFYLKDAYDNDIYENNNYQTLATYSTALIEFKIKAGKGTINSNGNLTTNADFILGTEYLEIDVFIKYGTSAKSLLIGTVNVKPIASP